MSPKTAPQTTTISLEFFPPKTEKESARFYEEVKKLRVLNSAFMTVTYGAGGSTREETLGTAIKLQQQENIGIASHLTCVNTFKDDIHKLAGRLWDDNIKHIIALRGDIPPVDAPLDYSDNRYYHYANELIDGLCAQHDFEISVAAYPEKHPDAPDLETDIRHLKQKCEAGNGHVKRAITQFFFDNTVYYEFLEKTAAAGITTPIVPGFLPINDIKRMIGFAKKCEARVPDWLIEKFEAVGEDKESQKQLAIDILAEQISALVDNGVPHLHFYTLNRAEILIAACKAAGLRL